MFDSECNRYSADLQFAVPISTNNLQFVLPISTNNPAQKFSVRMWQNAQ
jgi:hypothetical protein